MARSELLHKFRQLLPTASRAPNGCLIWTANRPNKQGLPTLAIGAQRRPGDPRPHTLERDYVHRLAWENATGRRIPVGGSIYHTCGIPACVEPEHLTLAGQPDTKPILSHHKRQRTHCPNGHPYTPENLYIRPNNGKRECRACREERLRRWHGRDAS